jgi:hypothetical protein
MAEGCQFPCPVVRAAARFQRYFGGGKFLEEGGHLGAAKIGLQHRPASLVDAVQGEDGLRRVDADALNLTKSHFLA